MYLKIVYYFVARLIIIAIAVFSCHLEGLICIYLRLRRPECVLSVHLRHVTVGETHRHR